MMLDAMSTRRSDGLDVKVFDGNIVHHFTIYSQDIVYEISMGRGELMDRATAEFQDLQQGNDRVERLVLRTSSHSFEILPGPNYTYQAYMVLIKIKDSKLVNSGQLRFSDPELLIL